MAPSKSPRNGTGSRLELGRRVESVRIRPAAHADVEALVRVHASSIRELCATSYTTDEIESWAADVRPEMYIGWIDTRMVIVAELEGDVVGLGQLNPTSGEIDKLFVHPAVARRGIGAALLRALEQSAVERGFTEVSLSASLNAAAFYAAAGFESRGRTMCGLRAGGALLGERMVKRLTLERLGPE
jgi:putative acetyltransferase